MPAFTPPPYLAHDVPDHIPSLFPDSEGTFQKIQAARGTGSPPTDAASPVRFVLGPAGTKKEKNFFSVLLKDFARHLFPPSQLPRLTAIYISIDVARREPGEPSTEDSC